jgi:uncharacterized protein DUF6200
MMLAMQLEDRQTAARATAPIVVSLGKESSKRIRRLKRGRGKLMNEVAHVVDQVRANFGGDADGKIFVPVVLVYQRKRRRPLGLNRRLFRVR